MAPPPPPEEPPPCAPDELLELLELLDEELLLDELLEEDPPDEELEELDELPELLEDEPIAITTGVLTTVPPVEAFAMATVYVPAFALPALPTEYVAAVAPAIAALLSRHW